MFVGASRPFFPFHCFDRIFLLLFNLCLTCQLVAVRADTVSKNNLLAIYLFIFSLVFFSPFFPLSVGGGGDGGVVLGVR